MSKVEHARPRYVAFRADGAGVSRRALSEAFDGLAKAGALGELRLTRFAAPFGIVRVPHETVAACRAALATIRTIGSKPAVFATLATSGTMAALCRNDARLPGPSEAPGKPGVKRNPNATAPSGHASQGQP